MGKKKGTEAASRRNDARANQQPGKAKTPKKKATKKAVGRADEPLSAAFAAVAANDIKAARELVGKVSLKDAAAQGKVRAAAEALKHDQLARARALLGQAASILRTL